MDLHVNTNPERASYESPPPKSRGGYSAAGKAMTSLMSTGISDEDKTHAMISTDHTLAFMPQSCWCGPRNVGIEAPQAMSCSSSGSVPLNVVASSFLPCGVQIAISSTTDFVTLKSFGVVSFRVLFSRDGGKDGAERGGTRGSGPPQVQIQDIKVPAPDRSSSSTVASPGDSFVNNSPSHSVKLFANPSTTTFKTPWPCSKVEAVIMQRNTDFPCIMEICTYSTSSIRSSAASTPQGKLSKPLLYR